MSVFGRRDRKDDFRGDPANDPTEADRLVLEQLREAGADSDETREVRHYLYVPSEAAAEALASIVRNEAHEAEVRAPEPADAGTRHAWLVLATSHAVVSEEGIAAARRLFTELAAEHGGEYDGWEAAV